MAVPVEPGIAPDPTSLLAPDRDTDDDAEVSIGVAVTLPLPLDPDVLPVPVVYPAWTVLYVIVTPAVPTCTADPLALSTVNMVCVVCSPSEVQYNISLGAGQDGRKEREKGHLNGRTKRPR